MAVCPESTLQMTMRCSGWQILEGEPVYEKKEECDLMINRKWVAFSGHPAYEFTAGGVFVQYSTQTAKYESVMDVLNIVFTSLFTLECIFKLFAFRFKVSQLVSGMSTRP